MDLPVRVRLRNQKSAATQTAATARVMTWVVRMARPSSRPVASRKPRAVTTKRSPSVKPMSSTPTRKRTMPFMTKVTPRDTMTKIDGAARCCR
jgi:mRNA-degrading endonuclease toxin of MazEF toxin-antitoxin module